MGVLLAFDQRKPFGHMDMARASRLQALVPPPERILWGAGEKILGKRPLIGHKPLELAFAAVGQHQFPILVQKP